MLQPRDEIVIVGVCAAGKSTLAKRLQKTGHRARTVAQEHSCIPDLWRHSGAATTIYLHASFTAVKRRRRSLMHMFNYEAQLHRLRSARADATLRLDTSNLTADEVYRLVRAHLDDQREEPRQTPVADEPGSDVQPRPAAPVPVPDEPGDPPVGTPYRGVPIPEEL